MPGRSRTHVSPGLLVICVPGQGTQKSTSDSFAKTGAGILHTAILLPPWEQGKSRACGHAKASLETPVPTSQGAVIFSLQELGYTQACVLMAELFIASRLSLGEPDFGCLENLCPQACTVAQYAFKTSVSGPHEEGDKEV